MGGSGKGALVVLQMEGCAVSKAMLDDITAQEASCRAVVERAQDKLKRLNLDAEVAKHQTALDDLQRRASALRQVRCGFDKAGLRNSRRIGLSRLILTLCHRRPKLDLVSLLTKM